MPGTPQLEKIAGCNFTYYIDVPHLCEYFAEACEGWNDPKVAVFAYKKQALEGNISAVVDELNKEYKQRPTHKGLKACIRYITNRPNQFDYPTAIRQGLPIGSGKVESTNKLLIQRRLKLPGCYWKQENAAQIADLRVLRANGGWDSYWELDSEDRKLRRAA